ncbi:MAG: FAD-dependent oxidoreductase [Lentisphaeria bacterium]|nr:FAD-dependent oxidoreductase [Lentisphaeria bacterium]
MKLIVVGGVAGGASAAAKARRADENADIILCERGEYVSFANCGLPYHLGNVISDRDSLLVMTPKLLSERAGLDVRVKSDVTAINRERKTVTVRNLDSGETYEESYDKLILATGSSPIKPPIPGVDDPHVMSLWTIPDMDNIMARINDDATSVVVIGAGFIGLEVAENLAERGLSVDLVEKMDYALPTIDKEMSQAVSVELTKLGVGLHFGSTAKAIEPCSEGGVTVTLDNGESLRADFVVMCAGVRPNNELAVAAGLDVTDRGGVVVDKTMRTSDPDIYAVGDVVSVPDVVTGQPAMIPLAGPANRQGRVAAVNACGGAAEYAGSLGTAIVKVGNLTVGSAGWTERRLTAENMPFEKLYYHGMSHAGYYPGAEMMAIKLLFADTGKILGAQIVGGEGVDKRLDVIATAMKTGLTVFDLADLELSYAPPYGSAKDPVNFIGMIAANASRGETRNVFPDTIPPDAVLLDIREEAEWAAGGLDGALFIPLGELRSRLAEIPRDKPVVAFCKLGLRGYLAERVLRQNGFDSMNLSGGLLTWDAFNPPPLPKRTHMKKTTATDGRTASGAEAVTVTKTIDVCGLQCPGPVVKVREQMEALEAGDVLEIKSTESFKPDLEAWCAATGHALLAMETGGRHTLVAKIQKAARVTDADMTPRCQTPAAKMPETAAIVVFSNDLDKVLAAFIIATGMAAMGVKVSMFFTFWGLTALRREQPPKTAKDILSRMFGFMLPKGPKKLALSKMHMLGMGTAMMKHVMKSKNVPSLSALIEDARAMGVTFIACEMAMNVMGITREELVELDDVAGVASFAALAKDSGTTLFI